MSDALHNDLFSSLISEIKTYTGKDPLLSWLKGIRRMKEFLPPQLLKEKMPRFLQKCAQTFETDRRYRNDLRYLRVWLQLMDFVDDPKALLRTMEMNQIGMKRSLFYQAYALYYEKMKKFDDAEKMYHLGVQNLAEPLDELQKSYEQFLHRVERHKSKKIQPQDGRTARRPLSTRSVTLTCSDSKENDENTCRTDGKPAGMRLKESLPEARPNRENVKSMKVFEDSLGNVMPMKQQESTQIDTDEPNMFSSDDTVVGKFVDTAILENSGGEDACHHGLLDPTINMKEAMNAINSMFREPLEPALIGRRLHRNQHKVDQNLKNGFEVFSDDSLENGSGSSHQRIHKGSSIAQHNKADTCKPQQEQFQIYIDEEGSDDVGNNNDEMDNMQLTDGQDFFDGSNMDASCAFVFPSPKDVPSESSDDMDVERPTRTKLREDTVVGRFVGSTIMDEPEVENVCHHGLVDPTINLKEAMDDINNMFGKPIEFVRANRRKKQSKAPDMKRDIGCFSILPDEDFKADKKSGSGGFSILIDNDVKPDRKIDSGGFSIIPDDDLKPQQGGLLPKRSAKSSESNLFEPTVFTKEAMDDINKMFGMPLDF